MDQTKVQQVFQAIADLRAAEERLAELGVLVCNRPLDCQYAEWLVAEIEGGGLARSRSLPDWDIELADATKVQVKVDRKANKWRGKFWIWKSTVDNLAAADLVIWVLLRDDRTVEGYFRVPVHNIRALSISTDRVSGREWYDIGREWVAAYKIETGLLDSCGPGLGSAPLEACSIQQSPVVSTNTEGPEPEAVTIQVPAYIWQALKESSAELGVTPESKLEQKIEEEFGPLCCEYGDLTEEEKQAIMRVPFEREDLWGSEEDSYWDQEMVIRPEPSYS